MEIKWSSKKNEVLRKSRGVSFEQVVEAVSGGDFIGPEDNPAKENQKRIIVRIDGYPCVVPFVIEENGDWFLKTIYPCRKMKGRFE